MSKAEDSTEALLSDLDNLPQELRDDGNWMCWKDIGEDEIELINPHTGDTAKSGVETGQFAEAKRQVKTSDASGIALAISSDDEYAALRFRNVAKSDNGGVNVEDWVEDVIGDIESYTEFGYTNEDILILAGGENPDGEYNSEEVRYISSGVVPVTGRAAEEMGELNKAPEEIERVLGEYTDYVIEEKDSGPDQSEEEGEEKVPETILADVRETVVKNFDEAQWHLTEAILSTHATLLIDEIPNCTGLMIVGASGAGKTTALKFFEGLEEQFYRSDEVTAASFVSHDASHSEEELQEIDLLPRIRHKSVLCRDMSTWFATDRESIRRKMSTMTNLMDGEGTTGDSGSHGQRGYEGDYRFSFIGASTPLDPRAWEVMGNAGFRFVFYHKQPRPDDDDVVKSNLFGESSYPEKVSNCKENVQSFLRQLWGEHDGYGSISDDDFTFSDDAQDALVYLGKVVKFSRATLTEGPDSDDPNVNREDPHRITALLRDITKGRALLNKETTVDVDDVIVSARIALSTMPSKRRPLVRALLDPKNDGQLTRKEAQDALDASKPTAIRRMELMDTLGIADYVEIGDDDRGTKKLELKNEFEWPGSLTFPTR